jgi:hypothetical protein
MRGVLARRHAPTASTSARVTASITFVSSFTVEDWAAGISARRSTAIEISISRRPRFRLVVTRTCRFKYSSQTSPKVSVRDGAGGGVSVNVPRRISLRRRSRHFTASCLVVGAGSFRALAILSREHRYSVPR